MLHASQAFSARRAEIVESLLEKERQQVAELQAEVAEMQLILEEQAWLAPFMMSDHVCFVSAIIKKAILWSEMIYDRNPAHWWAQ